jgi:glycine/D-amino acid oxidase-like deaminating enzyme
MELDAGADWVQLRTPAGVVQASRVILATNAYTSQILDGAPIEPVRGQMLATAPLNKAVAERPVYSNRGFRYWRQLRDGELLLGGWRDAAIEEEVGLEEEPTDHIQGRLDAHLQTFLGDGRVSRRWAGIMGFTSDRLPLVGPLPGREAILLCGGYSGHGLGLAFAAAELLTRHLTEGVSVPSWLLPARFLTAE